MSQSDKKINTNMKAFPLNLGTTQKMLLVVVTLQAHFFVVILTWTKVGHGACIIHII